MTIGHNMQRLLQFAESHPGWHDYSKKDRATVRALNSLEKLDLIQINFHRQFRVKPKPQLPKSVAH